MKNIYCYQTLIGEILIAEQDNKITNLYFGSEKHLLENYTVKETDILKEANKQLDEYLKGERKTFHLSLAPNGTEFRKKVWDTLLDIPYGETRSYKEIATIIGNEKATRAVGQANNKNEIPIFIPCHRVIGSNGSFTGYAGGIDLKTKLLDIEKSKML